ncbi:MAG: amidohydrolase family protein [bacterium]|nr:amidohydrolase family protein [bacterium]
MSEMIIRGGSLIDGTGAVARPADVRINQGVVTEIGPNLKPNGETELDASSCYVTPGFIDSHTHLDPYMFWDRGCDPMPQHGVTTALIGNCSLSLAPAKPEHLDELIDVFCYVEDLPVVDFKTGVPWNWTTWQQYYQAMNQEGTALNIIPLVGHTMLRTYAMGEDAWTRKATEQEISTMTEELADAMAAGCFGFSTSFQHQDRNGRLVPSQLASDTELAALADVLVAAGHGLVEFVPNFMEGDLGADISRMASVLGNRKVTSLWNALVHSDRAPEVPDQLMALTQTIRDGGCNMWPLASPRTIDININWDSTMVFLKFPQGWNKIMGVTGQNRAEMLADPGWREIARNEWDSPDNALYTSTWANLVRCTSVTNPENEVWLGHPLADLVAARGGHTSDVLADWILENNLEPGLVMTGAANSNVDAIGQILADDRCLISASDAGAHVQMMCAAGDSTLLLTRHVRDRGDLTLEKAIYEITGRQADVLGLHNRGRLAPGYAGDITVFNLDELCWETDSFVADLPSGARRLRRPPGGYRATAIGGVLTQTEGTLTGAHPGKALNSNTTNP